MSVESKKVKKGKKMDQATAQAMTQITVAVEGLKSTVAEGHASIRQDLKDFQEVDRQAHAELKAGIETISKALFIEGPGDQPSMAVRIDRLEQEQLAEKKKREKNTNWMRGIVGTMATALILHLAKTYFLH